MSQLIDIAKQQALTCSLTVGALVKLRPFKDIGRDIIPSYANTDGIMNWCERMTEQHTEQPDQIGRILSIFKEYSTTLDTTFTFAVVRWSNDCWSYLIDDLIYVGTGRSNLVT